MSITTTAADGLLRALPILWSLGAITHLLFLGVERGWRVVAGAERLDQEAMAARDRLAARNDALVAARRRVDEAEALVARLTQRTKAAEREVARLESRPPSFVHVLGEPSPENQVFHANVVRSGASAQGRPSLPIWGYANKLVVHAPSRDAARAAADRVFPEKTGYLKVFQN